jgi:hypothetical protein
MMIDGNHTIFISMRASRELYIVILSHMTINFMSINLTFASVFRLHSYWSVLMTSAAKVRGRPRYVDLSRDGFSGPWIIKG